MAIMSRGNLLLISLVFAQFVRFTTSATATLNASWVPATSNNHQLLPKDPQNVRLINYVSKVVCSLDTPLIYYYYEMDTVNRLEDNILKAIHQCSVAMIRAGTLCKKALPVDGKLLHMVIMLKNLNKTEAVMTVIDRHSASKEKSHFIVVIEKVDDDVESTSLKIKAFFECFWLTKRVLNAIIVFADENENVRTITYNPFFKNYYIELPSETFGNELLFPDKLLDLNKYQINVTLFADQNRMKYKPTAIKSVNDLQGLDGMFMRYVSKIMNANFTFVFETEKYHPNGDFFPNGSVSGVLKKIINNHAEISFNSRFYRFKDFTNRLEPSIVIGRDDICFFVPKVTKVEFNPSNLTLAFSGLVWMILFGFLLSGAAFWITLEKVEGYKKKGSFHLLNLWRVMLLQNLPGISKHTSIRIFLGFWMIYTLLMSNCYSGDLVSQLVSPQKLKQINHITTLASLNFKIVAEEYYVLFFEKNMNSSKEFGAFKDKFISLQGKGEVIEQIAKQEQGVAFLSKRSEIESYFKKKAAFTNDGHLFYHLVGECAVPNFLIYIVQYGSPYLSRLNTILGRLFESCIQDFWEDRPHSSESDEISKEMMLKMKAFREVKSDQGLKLEHLQTAFYLLIGGDFIALIFFLLEYSYGQLILHRLKKDEHVLKLTKRTIHFKTPKK